MTCNPPLRTTWEARLAHEGLKPLDDGRRMRQNPLRDQRLSERTARSLRVLADILAWGYSDDGELPADVTVAGPSLFGAKRQRQDAFLASWLAEGGRPVDLARQRPDLFDDSAGAKPVYDRAARLHRLASMVLLRESSRLPVDELEQRGSDILELFAEAQGRSA
jgi:hypothetical protein